MKTLIAKDLKKALISGSYTIINNRNRIDALNVFPVPDGDTGSNMSGTVQSAIEAVEFLEENSAGIIMRKFARGAFLGARGNSGVILSQIFEGFAVALEGKKEINTFDLVKCFQEAKQYAYKSVMKPIEGTLLTVIRIVAEDLSASITPSNDILTVFEKAVQSARKACDLTPSMLPVLKEVGVTDSGGEGFWYILTGMLEALKGKPITSEISENNKEFIIGFEKEEYESEFGYCTEGLVELKNKDRFNIEKFKQSLGKIGNSIVVVRNDEIVKIHIHTLNPGSALNFMQKLGEFYKIKVENMTLQANQSKGQKDHLKNKPVTNILQNQENLTDTRNHEEKNLIEVISCNDGSGLIKEMHDLGANTIIEGGQANNPSTRDFLNAIKKITAQNIIILPNNPNITLVAQQIVQTVENKNIIIVPTKTQVEGITAMLNFDPSNTLEENQELMLEGIASMDSGSVTSAIKNTKINGVTIKKGQYLALANRQVVKSTNSKIDSAIAIVDHLINDDTQLVTIWYGANATEMEANTIGAHIESNYDISFEIKQGNQHIYEFLISFE